MECFPVILFCLTVCQCKLPTQRIIGIIIIIILSSFILLRFKALFRYSVYRIFSHMQIFLYYPRSVMVNFSRTSFIQTNKVKYFGIPTCNSLALHFNQSFLKGYCHNDFFSVKINQLYISRLCD